MYVRNRVLQIRCVSIAISVTIGDTGMVKLWQSCAFWYVIICRWENCEFPSTFGDIREKPKNCYFVLIFFWCYFNTYKKIRNTFSLPLFALNKTAFTDFQYDVLFLRNHHQLYFFKYGPVFFILPFKSFWPPNFSDVSHLSQKSSFRYVP
jgi:hypothetical protein